MRIYRNPQTEGNFNHMLLQLKNGTGGPRYIRSFYLRIRVSAIVN